MTTAPNKARVMLLLDVFIVVVVYVVFLARSMLVEHQPPVTNIRRLLLIGDIFGK